MAACSFSDRPWSTVIDNCFESGIFTAIKKITNIVMQKHSLRDSDAASISSQVPDRLKLKQFILGFFTADFINHWSFLRTWRMHVEWYLEIPNLPINHELKQAQRITHRTVTIKGVLLAGLTYLREGERDMHHSVRSDLVADCVSPAQACQKDFFPQWLPLFERSLLTKHLAGIRSKKNSYVYLRWLLIGIVVAAILVAFPPAAPAVFAALSHAAWLGLLAGSAVSGCLGLVLLMDGLAKDFSLIKRNPVTGERRDAGVKLFEERNQSKDMLVSLAKIIAGGILLSLPCALLLPIVIMPALKAVGLYAAQAAPTALTALALVGKSFALCAAWQISFDLIGAFFHKLAHDVCMKFSLDPRPLIDGDGAMTPKMDCESLMNFARRDQIRSVHIYTMLGKFFCAAGIVSILGAAVGALASGLTSVSTGVMSVFKAKAVGAIGSVAITAVPMAAAKKPTLLQSVESNQLNKRTLYAGSQPNFLYHFVGKPEDLAMLTRKIGDHETVCDMIVNKLV
jgi:hypothetical protein